MSRLFLSRNIEGGNTPGQVLTGHRPMYSQELGSGDPTMIEAIEPFLLAAKVDVALWAHDHVYMRSCPIVSNGTCAGTASVQPSHGGGLTAVGVAAPSRPATSAPVHVVCGTAGAFRDDTPGNGTAAAWVVAMDACEGCQHWGYCRFVANATTLTMEYVGYIGLENASSTPPTVVDRLSLLR
jgi:hypothetical protein